MGNPLVYKGMRPQHLLIGSSSLLAQSAGQKCKSASTACEVDATGWWLPGATPQWCAPLNFLFWFLKLKNVLCRAKVHLEVESQCVLCQCVECCFVCALFAPCTIEAKRAFGVFAVRLVPHAYSLCVCSVCWLHTVSG